MLDFGNLPKPLTGTIDYFPGFCSVTGTVWEVWNKPRGCNFVRILCIGAGGGGGGGSNGGATSTGGGGGGASGAMSVVTIPAIFLPDRLYVSSGVGGKGGGSATTGNSGAASEVCIAPANVAIYILCYANSGTGGGGGSTSSGGAGGTGGAQAVISTALQGFQGHFNSIAGQNGAAGALTTGGSITYPTTGLLLSGGSAGGGIALTNNSTPAGNVNAPASQTSTYNLFQTLSASLYFDGQNGIELSVPLMSCGGVGGSGSLSGGSNGGNGGFGSGGGGGGAAGVGGALGGTGGDGGNGLVVIQTW